jgi:hypothetical protein
LDEDENGKTVVPNHWGSARKPGMFISMALIKRAPLPSNLSDNTIHCPACNAPHTEHGNLTPVTRVRWYVILTFFSSF